MGRQYGNGWARVIIKNMTGYFKKISRGPGVKTLKCKNNCLGKFFGELQLFIASKME
jgi:hypothetical protein